MSQPLVKEFRAPPDIYVAASNASVTYSSQANELPATDPNGTIPFSHITEPVCQWILYWNLDNTRVRVWDVMVLAPNALFMIFLLVRLKPNISNLRASTSPMFTAFYSLVCVVSFISILRCIMSMTINGSQVAGNIADRMMWLILRFFLLSTEASVITFGFYFGYLDSRTSIQRVLICTSFFALGYSAVQGTLELKYEHTAFSMTHGDNSTESFDVFAHGGMIFLSASSFAFCLVYFIILILPLTRIKEKIVLPSKPSFYNYVCVLAVLNLVQAVGSLLVYQRVEHALCVVDTTTYVYFTLFDPLVYATFLWKFFRNRPSGSLLFSYSHQEEDIQRDAHLSLPSHGPSFAIKRDDGGVAIATVDRQTRFSASVAITPPTRLPTPFLSINDEWHHDTN